ncbi:hypothetical protein UFOVP359_67 [uncultured Caudovirales phage]|uniref:Uncharacterized protein n=1 Tax=uncultured Caudovirales phage TaxID=2100421 RepID=A0A6J7X0E7_9CAUD|nr:hypothetical protein UFOVP359_67 [uncultured Caudovirales phage]
MLTTGLTSIDESYRKSSTIYAKHKILAEWNHNSYYKTLSIGSYPYYIDPASTSESYPIDTDTYNADPVVGAWDNGGFYKTIAVDNTTTVREDKIKKELCSIYNIIESERPDPGIIYAIGSNVNTTIIPDSKTIKSYNILESNNRLYPLSKTQSFKYWNSYRYCKPNSTATQAITCELIGKADSNLEMKGNNVFVVYDGNLKTNKIVIKTQIANGYARDFTVEVLRGNNTWTPIYTETNTTRSASAKQISTTGISGSRNLTLTDNSDIYVGMSVSGTGISSGSTVTSVGKDGLVVISIALTQTITNQTLSFTDLPSLADGIVRLTAKRVSGSIVWSLAGAVEKENAVSNLGIVSSPEYDVIKGLRFSAQKMSSVNSMLDVIEVSPRLVVDLSSYTEGLSIDASIGDTVFGLPAGSTVSSEGSIDFFNENNLISNKNSNSVLDDLLKPNVKFTILNVVQSGIITKYIPVKVMYATSWDEMSDWKVRVNLKDFMKFLEDKPCPDILLASRGGIKVSAIIKILLDNCGVTRFNFIRSKDQEEYLYEDIPLDFFRCRKENSVMSVLNEIGKSAQLSMFFDNFNNLTVMTKEATSTKTELYDYWLVGDINNVDANDDEYDYLYNSETNSFEYSSNLEGFEDSTIPPITSGEVLYENLGIEKKPLGLVNALLDSDAEKVKNVEAIIADGGYSELYLNREISYVPNVVWQPATNDLESYLACGMLGEKMLGTNAMSFFDASYTAVNENDAIKQAYQSLSANEKKHLTIFLDESSLTSSFSNKYSGIVSIDDEIIKYNGMLYKVFKPGFITSLQIFFSKEEKENEIFNAPSGSSFIPVGLIVSIEMSVIGQPSLTNNNYSYKVVSTGRGYDDTRIAEHIPSNNENSDWTSFATKLYSSTQPATYPTLNLITQTQLATGVPDIDTYVNQNSGYAKLIGPPSNLTSVATDGLPGSDQIIIKDGGQQHLTGFKKSVGFNPVRIGTKMKIIGGDEKSTNSRIAGIGIYNSTSQLGNTGYFLEFTTVSESFNPEETEQYNIRFYKVTGSDKTPFTIALAQGKINATAIGGEGSTPVYAALKNKENFVTTFTVDIIVTQINDSTRKFRIFVEGAELIVVTDTTAPSEGSYVPATQNISMFVRDDSSAIFEYFYATALPDNIDVSVNDPILNGPEPYKFEQAIERGIFSSSIRSILGTDYPLFYEDFGSLVREVRKVQARFGFPTFASQLIEFSSVIPDYIVKNYKYTSFGAEFWIYNTSSTAVRLDSDSSIPMYISGIVLNNLGNGSINLDEYIDSIDLDERKNQEIEINKRLYGDNSISISGQYISSIKMAKDLAKWIAKNSSKEKTVIDAEIFPNPLLQLGDKIKVFYKDRGYCVEQNGNKTYLLSSINYVASGDDLVMRVQLREML